VETITPSLTSHHYSTVSYRAATTSAQPSPCICSDAADHLASTSNNSVHAYTLLVGNLHHGHRRPTTKTHNKNNTSTITSNFVRKLNHPTAAVASIAPAETLVWRKCTLPRVRMLLDSQTGQLVNTSQTLVKMFKSGQKVKD